MANCDSSAQLKAHHKLPTTALGITEVRHLMVSGLAGPTQHPANSLVTSMCATQTVNPSAGIWPYLAATLGISAPLLCVLVSKCRGVFVHWAWLAVHVMQASGAQQTAMEVEALLRSREQEVSSLEHRSQLDAAVGPCCCMVLCHAGFPRGLLCLSQA